ncbi:MAG: InlB B-repeat-containing protein [Planctomycetota bacterium]|jgi:hypothetical protein
MTLRGILISVPILALGLSLPFNALAVNSYNQTTFARGMTPLSTSTTIWPVLNYTQSTFALGMTSIQGTSGATTLWSTATTNSMIDDSVQTINIGFSFTYYGTTYTTVQVATNGYIHFGTTTVQITNQTIGASTALHGFCAPCWDDLEAYNSYGCVAWIGYVVTGSAGSRVLTVEWWNMDHESSNSTGCVWCQVKLAEANGVVEFHYSTNSLNMNRSVVSASIGIEHPSGTPGVGGPNTGTTNRRQTVNYRFTPQAPNYDDQSSMVSLGFNFPFFGTLYSQAYVSTNGFLTFTNVSATDATNDPIPDPNVPDNYIALFWDDLIISQIGVLDRVTYSTAGTAPNRIFTLEYYGVTRSGQAGSEMTGQIVLYEGTNVIELKYDNTAANNVWTGVDATIGIEDVGGTAGFGGPNTTNTIGTLPASNFRFTPYTYYVLTVNGNPNNYGTPNPPYGTTNYNQGTVVTAIANSPAPGPTGTRYVCTGWTGTGSVPATGTGSSCTFNIAMDSSITWLWTTEVLLNMTANPVTGGTTVSTPTGPWFAPGTLVTITANPNGQFLFNNWTGAINSINNPENFTITTPMNITANFLPPASALTISGNPTTYGTPNPPYGVHQFNPGTQVTASVTSPIPGPTGTQYVCTGWTGTGDVPLSGSGTTVTFTFNSTSTLIWQWEVQYQLTLNVSPSGAGSAASSPVGPWIPEATSVTLTATPLGGFQFFNWTGALTSTNNPETYVMTAPSTITANFRPPQRTLTVDSLHGSPDPPVGVHSYDQGTSVVCTVTSPIPAGAGTRYLCTGWSGTGDVPLTGTGSSVSITLNQNSTITWNWELQYEVATVANPPAGGTIILNPGGNWYPTGTNVSVQALTNTSYNFTGWGGDLSGTVNPESITVTGPVSVIADFQAQGPSLTVNSAYGFPTPGVGVQSYLPGSQVDCSVPTPASGLPGVRYVCTGWTGTGSVTPSSGTGNAVSVTLNVDSTITWHWRVEYSITSTMNPAGVGTVSRTPPQTWFVENSTVTITAIPNSGYNFFSWSGDVVSSENPTFVLMDGPKTLTANFIGGIGLGLSAGPSNPGDTNERLDATGVPMLQLALTAGHLEPINVSVVRISVTGSSNEAATVTNADLFVDVDGDGRYTPMTDRVFQGGQTFPADEGTAVFTATPPVQVPASEALFLLLTFDLNATVNDDFRAQVLGNADVTAVGASSGLPVSLIGAPVVGGQKKACAAGTAGTLSVFRGLHSAPSATLPPGSSSVAMVQFGVRTSSLEGGTISAVTFTGTGSGNDATEVTGLRLYRDTNGNGLLDSGEPLLGTGTYGTNDGTVTISGMNESLTVSSQTFWLVTYNFSAGAGTGSFRTGIAQETDITVTGGISAGPMDVYGPPLSGSLIKIETPTVTETGEFTYFAGTCGGPAVVGIPLLPLFPLAVVLLVLGRRRGRRS